MVSVDTDMMVQMKPVLEAVDEILFSEPLPKGDREETQAEVLDRVLEGLCERMSHDDVMTAQTIATNQCLRMSFDPRYNNRVRKMSRNK